MWVDCANVHEETKASKLSLEKREGSFHCGATAENKGRVINKDGESDNDNAPLSCARVLGIDEFTVMEYLIVFGAHKGGDWLNFAAPCFFARLSKCLEKEEEQYGCHVITLSNANSVRNLALVVFVYFKLHVKIFMESTDCIDKERRSAIFSKEGKEQVMVCGVECFDQINKKNM